MEDLRHTDYFFDKKNWEKVSRRIVTCGRIALFLDFDGTLVPIQEDPAHCVLARKIKGQLKALTDTARCSITILSGRSLPDIKSKVGIPNICYGGNHGLVIFGKDTAYVHERALLAKPSIDKAARMLNKEIEGIDGAWVERKRFTASLHYRMASKEDIPSLKRAFSKVVSEFSSDGLAIIKGKMVLELVPDSSWTKGSAALRILHHLNDKYLPIYIGDDITDESVFRALHGKGITVKVGRSANSAAKYYLKDQGEVSQVLQHLLDILKADSAEGRSL